MSATPKSGDSFKFRRHDTLGAAAAEDDALLPDSYVDTGDLAILRQMADHRTLIVGNTGCGKTALLNRLRETEERVIVIRPESLALAHVSNSTIIQFLHSINIKVDIFFRLLWRHVFAIELLRAHFKVPSQQDTVGLLDRVRARLKTPQYRAALSYLERWGSRFWEETETRVREVTTSLETAVRGELNTKYPSLELSAETSSSLSEIERRDIAQRIQKIVNDVQVRQLAEIPDLVSAALDDRQKNYFVVIDGLDTDWVDDQVRYRLIRALVETTKDFHLNRAKIIVALRVDLLERVFRLTRDAGFQEEKYHALYLNLDWNKNCLVQLMDARFAALARRKSSQLTANRSHKEFLTKQVQKQSAVDYILDRTMMRPRDVILFLNACIAKAVNHAVLTAGIIQSAEEEYSRLRLRALADEWHADFPNLEQFAGLLHGRPPELPINALADDVTEEFCLECAIAGSAERDILSEQNRAVIESTLEPRTFVATAVTVFYKVGLVGLRPKRGASLRWSYGRKSLGAEITADTWVSIHPAFWRALAIRPKRAAHS